MVYVVKYLFLKLLYRTFGYFHIFVEICEFPLTATLMPRLPLLFLSSRTNRSAVFKLMMDGDLEHVS